MKACEKGDTSSSKINNIFYLVNFRGLSFISLHKNSIILQKTLIMIKNEKNACSGTNNEVKHLRRK